VLSPVAKTNNEKSSWKTLEFGQERLQTSERENKDNLPLGGLEVKVVYKMSS